MSNHASVAILARAGWLNLAEADEKGKRNLCFAPLNEANAELLKQTLEDCAQSEHKCDLSEIKSPIQPNDKRKRDGRFSYPDPLRELPFVVNASTQFEAKTFWTRSRVACDPNEIQGGDTVMVEVKPYAWSYQGRKGVGLGFSSVWLIKKGEVAIGGAAKTGEAFNSVDVSELDFDDELDT